MTNLEILTTALSEWLSKVAASVLPSVQIQPTSGLGRLMSGFLNIDLSTYSIYEELGFLITPTIHHFVAPMVSKYLSVIPDADIPAMAKQYTDLMIQQAKNKGYVNVFGIELGAASFERLQELINERFTQ